ncbi:hypothetical protein P7D22_17290 [Lichenihabitans sp. Uapishka_5]|uniref:hypothetical protein n=1 Tax=Lichenihabitans sp. Uapishka_5 TaxID=3037302 RepID=UPI0029E7F878|nr:hypothetical protein [Lichenihabitans sp. Uapishka_5]MDX7952922.1 hypothetical protein [Lichenihabitans sp. Uapishka_5]
MVDFRRLERESYGPAVGTGERVRLTPELLGQLVSCALQLEGNREEAISSDVFEDIFLNSGQALPTSIAGILHVEERLGGARVEEVTRMAVASQASGVAGRMNPDNVSMIPKTDRLQAHALLSYYAVSFPKEVDWLKQVVRQRAGSAAAG